MYKFTAAIISLIMLTSVSPAFAQELAGQYRMEGANPDGKGVYRGEVAVMQTGRTYQVTWAIGTNKHIGTGIRQDGVFSVIYQPEGSAPGIAVYKISPDGILTGNWTTLKGQVVGTETWIPDKGI